MKWAGFLMLLLMTAVCYAGEPLTTNPNLHPAEVKGDLQVWAWNIAGASLQHLTPGFNEKYPNVKVYVNVSGADLQSRFLLSLSAGVGAPDVSQLQAREAPRYAMTGKLTDLTPLAKQYAHAFVPSFWDNCVYDGKIYAIPWDMGPCGIFYKRSLFKKYDINPEQIETWDEYIAAGKKIRALSGGKTWMLCLSTGIMTEFFEMLLTQSGGQIFDEQGKIVLNSSATEDAMNVIKKLLDADISLNTPAFSHEYLASLKTDVVASYPFGAWFGGTIRDYAPDTAGDWGVMRLPAIQPGGLRTSNLGGSVLVIPDQCEQKEAAWAFMEYTLCMAASQIEQYRAYELFPALLVTHQDPFFDEQVPFYGNQQVRRLFSMDIDKIPTMSRTTDWMEAVTYIDQSISQWANGDRGSPAHLLDTIATKLARRLNRSMAEKTTSGDQGREH